MKLLDFLVQDKHVHLIGQGGPVNLTGPFSMGHPIEVIDQTMGLLLLAASHMVDRCRDLAPGVHDLPDELDLSLAELKLETLGIEIDR